MQSKTLLIALFMQMMGFISSSDLHAQMRTFLSAEDSLHLRLGAESATVIGGYGEAAYQRDFDQGNSRLNLTRTVLFVGHQFTDRIAFFSEMELESAKVEGGDEGGEIAMEQAYLKFSGKRHPQNYWVGGLFIPRIGCSMKIICR
ncbi:MAG: hypothetical protein K6T34_03405 [Thermoflavifilum sp.]|nr:hypothetical protein [Thermoflavifilum sp.]